MLLHLVFLCQKKTKRFKDFSASKYCFSLPSRSISLKSKGSDKKSCSIPFFWNFKVTSLDISSKQWKFSAFKASKTVVFPVAGPPINTILSGFFNNFFLSLLFLILIDFFEFTKIYHSYYKTKFLM